MTKVTISVAEMLLHVAELWPHVAAAMSTLAAYCLATQFLSMFPSEATMAEVPDKQLN